IACYAAFSINGVAALHTEIIKAETLRDWHEFWPEKFNNKTNGDADGILEDSIMNRSYTNTQKRTALRVYKRTQSVTKTVRELG
ncbi:glycogen/starch/alpha-glucan phosphorylase, partial [Corynebacterium belfantii]|uniref:glycogen/starch/alpha-glucan phosphorylase n=1 Tax=Corynebacterium belfantii TaxID=2014537 RepID=UPI001F3CCF8F